MNHKLSEWLRRYLPREIIGTITAVLASLITYKWTGSEIAAAFAGTWGENLGFYGYGISKEVLFYLEKHHDSVGIKKVFIVGYKTLRNILIEFGPSEILDSFILRPALMYAAQLLLGMGLGTLAGKLAADVVFYSLAIVAYEMRKRYVRG